MSVIENSAKLQPLLGTVVEVHVGRSIKVTCYVRGVLKRSVTGSDYVVMPEFLSAMVSFTASAIDRIEPTGPACQAAGVMARIYV